MTTLQTEPEFCGKPGTGECSCAKFGSDPINCGRLAEWKAEQSKPVVLTLPVMSANKYWRPVHIGNHITIVPTKEAKQYKAEVQRIAIEAGVTEPIKGRIKLEIWLYPHRPLDWQKRQRQHGDAWSDTVQCIDLGNCEKVLSDALNGICFVDDGWHRVIIKQRMEPDGGPYRIVARISPIPTNQPPQGELL